LLVEVTMYKLLLCWRYLLTRYLALVCIVSVMLGVATLIVVNSVMSGFSSKLRDRLHGLLSDVVIESDFEGFPDPDGQMARIRQDPFLNERIAAMAPTLEIFAMLQFNWKGVSIMRAVHLIGIDPEARARLGGFAEHLVNNPRQPLELSPEALERYRQNHRKPLVLGAGWPPAQEPLPGGAPDGKPPPDPPPSRPEADYVPEPIIIGYALAHFRKPKTNPDEPPEDVRTLWPGDDVVITTVSGAKLEPVNYRYVVSDYFRSEMSEYDSQYVFVPLAHLQKLRTMENRATSIQIRLKDYRDAKAVVERLRTILHGPFEVKTWEDKQGALLAAIRVEKGILNVLLFLIVGVAGFGILAIFSMIVVEKTRDIGILKALGASNGGVMKIFLGYGLLLGVVGAGFGTALGVTLTVYINQIEAFLAHLTGMELFPRGIYYFNEIPTDVQPLSVALVNAGAVAIAVVFSVLPALRAALLHPVRALRYE
jgi:lipoprotein-releasing system permease protein